MHPIAANVRVVCCCCTRGCWVQDALALGVIVGLIWVAVLGWVAGFIRSATEVVYVCFARDLDNRAVTRPDVHAVLKDVPAASGAVVVQPDENLVRPPPLLNPVRSLDPSAATSADGRAVSERKI